MSLITKVHGANMGAIWGRQDPGGIHVGPMNFAIWGAHLVLYFPTKYVFRFIQFTYKINHIVSIHALSCTCVHPIQTLLRSNSSHLFPFTNSHGAQRMSSVCSAVSKSTICTSVRLLYLYNYHTCRSGHYWWRQLRVYMQDNHTKITKIAKSKTRNVSTKYNNCVPFDYFVNIIWYLNNSSRHNNTFRS